MSPGYCLTFLINVGELGYGGRRYVLKLRWNWAPASRWVSNDNGTTDDVVSFHRTSILMGLWTRELHCRNDLNFRCIYIDAFSLDDALNDQWKLHLVNENHHINKKMRKKETKNKKKPNSTRKRASKFTKEQNRLKF